MWKSVKNELKNDCFTLPIGVALNASVEEYSALPQAPKKRFSSSFCCVVYCEHFFIKVDSQMRIQPFYLTLLLESESFVSILCTCTAQAIFTTFIFATVSFFFRCLNFFFVLFTITLHTFYHQKEVHKCLHHKCATFFWAGTTFLLVNVTKTSGVSKPN